MQATAGHKSYPANKNFVPVRKFNFQSYNYSNHAQDVMKMYREMSVTKRSQ